MSTNPLIKLLPLLTAPFLAGCDQVIGAADEVLGGGSAETTFDRFHSCEEKWTSIEGSRTAQRLCFDAYSLTQITNRHSYTGNSTEPYTNEFEGAYTINPTITNEDQIYLYVDGVSVTYSRSDEGNLQSIEMIFDCDFQVIGPYSSANPLCRQTEYDENEDYSEYVNSSDWEFNWNINTAYYIQLTEEDF